MKEYWVNVYYHSTDDKCYQGLDKYKSRYEAIGFHNLFRNAFRPRPILAYLIHVKIKQKKPKYDDYKEMYKKS